MQEALDRAEKARKAASSAVAEGGKQKRRNSAAAGADDGSQGLTKNSVKKNPQGQNKAAGKAGQGSSSGTPETTSKKSKAAAAAGKQVTSSKLSPGELAGDKSANGIVAAIDGGIVNPSNVEDPLQANERPLIDAQPAAPAADQSESHDLPETVDSEGITSSLLSTDDAAGVKRKTPVPDRQKGQPNMSAGRQGGISGSASSSHHPQARDLGRGGAATGRGGRGHGGKASRNGNASSSKYSDSGMSLSPRGSAKPGLLSPPGGYQGLPYETSMAAAVNAPGFVPFGSQFSHPFYPRGYHYGSNSHAGVSSSGSDSGGYDFTPNVQQGGQQPYMPYNMAFMPQQRPVTEIPGLDSLRYYILGQIEYYFSIHNLCMDQFLKEQVSDTSSPKRVGRDLHTDARIASRVDGFAWLGRHSHDSFFQQDSPSHHR
jgi:la-related protein 1